MRDETTFNFSGPFRDVMPLYIKYRRSLGYKVAESELYRMKELDVFFERHGITEPCISREMYDKWTSLRDGQRPVTICKRQAFIRGLGRYMSASGYQDVYTGEDDKRCFESDYIPYVFTMAEIKRIFSEMDGACLKKPSFLNHSFRLIVSLCYCCGLRKSEAVSLKIKDIDFQTGKINILNSKRDVSRIIVVSSSLLKIMEKYYNDYCTGYGQDDWFIQNSKGGAYCKATLYKLYHELLEKAGIPERSDGRIHRLHDMRHAFCVHTLEQMQAKGFDLYTSLPCCQCILDINISLRQNTTCALWTNATVPCWISTHGIVRPFSQRRWMIMKTDSFAYHVTRYFSDYLPNQTAASPNTIHSYRDTFVQLLNFFKKEKHVLPEKLRFSDFTSENVEEFLCWLEKERGIGASTRNQRLAAVHAFFRYIQYREPAGFEQCAGVLAVPFKKTPSPSVDYMSLEEMQVLFSVPDQTDQKGLRDLTVMLVLYETGARVQELIDLQAASFRFGSINHVQLHGKGDKSRIVPINARVASVTQKYIKRYGRIQPDALVFTNRTGGKLTRAGVQYIIDKNVALARKQHPNLFTGKITNHSFRHSKAMHLLEAGVNLVYIRDFLGHSSIVTTEVYARSNPKIKEEHLRKNSASLEVQEKYSAKEKDDLMNWLKKSL